MEGKKILVLDDDRYVRDWMQKSLSEEGCCVKTVKSAKEALKFLKETKTDLIITDIFQYEMKIQ